MALHEIVSVGEKLPTIEKLVTQERIERYAAAAGDFNPIHIDPVFAASSQFGCTIAHGMMIAATLSESLSQAFKRSWPDGGRLKIRFKSPVFPGDTVATFGEVKKNHTRDGIREVICSVGVRKQTGEVVITGEATILVTSAA